jgi:dTDP-4-dehydrorhamnose 3,5-epimerase
MEGVIIKKIQSFEDERGWLAEVFRNDEINYLPAMAYVSVTKPGVIRGPHEHKAQSDCFIFTGPGEFELHLWDRREGKTKDDHKIIVVGQSAPTMVIIPPGVVHGYKCVSEIPAYSINLPNRLYKGESKAEEVDEIRWEQRDDSLYYIN